MPFKRKRSSKSRSKKRVKRSRKQRSRGYRARTKGTGSMRGKGGMVLSEQSQRDMASSRAVRLAPRVAKRLKQMRRNRRRLDNDEEEAERDAAENFQINVPSRFDWTPRHGLVEHRGRNARKVSVEEMNRPEVQAFIHDELMPVGPDIHGIAPQWSNESGQVFGVSQRCAPKRFAPGKGWTAVPKRFKDDPILRGLVGDCGAAHAARPRRATKQCSKKWKTAPVCCLKQILSTLSVGDQKRFRNDPKFRAKVYNRKVTQAKFGACLTDSLRSSIGPGESGDYVNFLQTAEDDLINEWGNESTDDERV